MSSEPGRERVGSSDVADVDEPSMVLSEEVAAVRLETRASGRIRLRKRVVVDTFTQTVERRREELVVEQLDISRDLQPTAGTVSDRRPFDDDDLELVLYAEEVVLTTRVVPVERVRLSVRTVSEEFDVSNTVRREHADYTIIDAGVSASHPMSD